MVATYPHRGFESPAPNNAAKTYTYIAVRNLPTPRFAGVWNDPTPGGMVRTYPHLMVAPSRGYLEDL